MKIFVIAFVLLAFIGCEEYAQKSDKEKENSQTNIEIKTDSGEVKVNDNGISVKAKDDNNDSVNIKINSADGIKIEGKDGKVELKTDGGGKIQIEKKGKDVNIQIKEKK
jgi:hypothetical protein